MMKRLCIYTLVLIGIGALGEAGSSAFATLPAEFTAAALPWRILLMIALPVVGIYGRRRDGRR